MTGSTDVRSEAPELGFGEPGRRPPTSAAPSVRLSARGAGGSTRLIHSEAGVWLVKSRRELEPHRDAQAHLCHGALEHEAQVCALAHRLTGPTGDPIAPEVCAVDSDRGFVIFEALGDSISLHEVFERGDDRECHFAELLGRTLARVHSAHPPTGEPKAISPIPAFDGLDPGAAAYLPGDSLDLIAEIQGTPGLLEVLADLADASPKDTLVHGDMKLDNVLARISGAPSLRLVDWEHGGLGDPKWDIGSAVGDYLFRWLYSLRPSRGPLEDRLRVAGVPRARVTSLVRALLSGYETERAIDRTAVGRYVGLFLLHRAQACIDRYGSYGQRARILTHVGKRLCLVPERAWAGILGRGVAA